MIHNRDINNNLFKFNLSIVGVLIRYVVKRVEKIYFFFVYFYVKTNIKIGIFRSEHETIIKKINVDHAKQFYFG